jgi:uncharacterized protein (DUF2141 family)
MIRPMIRWTMCGLGSLWCVGALLPIAQAEINLASQLTIEIIGLASSEGNVCLKVFSGSQGFPRDDDSAVLKRCVPIADEPGEAFRITLDGLDAGTYAIAIYHDANGDEVLNRGLFGMPSEGYGFSNDAIATTGPAAYEDAVFILGGATTVPITMQYP